MSKSIRGYIFSLIPLRFHLFAFYYYYKFANKLEPELGSLRQLLPNCRVAVDVGANRGLYTYVLSSFCKQVVAFEPQPWCYSKIAASANPKIVAHNVGLSDKAGTLNLHVPHDNKGRYYDGLASFRELPNSKKIQVPVSLLDDYSLSEVDFIKIDVEGHEFEVITGAEKTILRNKPILLIEIEQRHITRPINEIFGKVSSLGYDGFYLQDGELISIDNFSCEEHQEAYLSDVSDRRYINNFFFIPKTDS